MEGNFMIDSKSDTMIDPAPMAFELLMQTIFNGRCPYTDDPCETFDCSNCEVERDEAEWLTELDLEEELTCNGEVAK